MVIDAEIEVALPEIDDLPESPPETIFGVENVSVRYGDAVALRDISLDIVGRKITALIGPSGCGKSTLIRCFNRMNDLIPGAHVDGSIAYHGKNLYDSDVDPIEVRRRIGMVFQQPNPFPKSIHENVAFGLRVNKMTDDIDDRIEQALKNAALWNEVKNKLKNPATSLSGGQQQRLCIARALATQPDVILMDEPCSALDPIATTKIEDLMHELKDDYTIVIVTHNMQQAARVSDRTAFLSVQGSEDDGIQPSGILIEYDETEKIFTKPSDPRTEDYITGRFG
jgi:phosphate transport system ATP-binding protein